MKTNNQLIEEAGLLVERLDDCFRSEANDSFHNHVGLVKEMNRIVSEHLSTIASKSGEEERKNLLKEVKQIVKNRCNLPIQDAEELYTDLLSALTELERKK